MRIKIVGLVCAIAILLATIPAHAKAPKPIKYSGSSGSTFLLNSNKFMPTSAQFIQNITFGTDTFGAYQEQSITTYSDLHASCTAPDSTVGELFNLDALYTARTYTKTGNQLWGDSDTGTLCISNFDSVFGGTDTLSI